MAKYLFLSLIVIVFCVIVFFIFIEIESVSNPTASATPAYDVEMEPYSDDVYTIAFYNVENLFDTEDDPTCNDNDFLPHGKKNWTDARYTKKIEQLALAINKLGDDNGPEILGLCEVENRQVIDKLISNELIKPHKYGIVHYDSPDPRGIDNALIYKKDAFYPFVTQVNSIKTFTKTSMRTRDILLVGGIAAGDSVFVLVNHWPSRMKGKEHSEPNRIAMAKYLRYLVDSLHQVNADYKCIVMGDFNDEPSDKSIVSVLNASCVPQSGQLYNPFGNSTFKGKGTYRYRSHWNLLDQIIINEALHKSEKGLVYKKGGENIYSPRWLYFNENVSKKPYSTFSGNKYQGGFSDHFPVYINFSVR